VAPLQKESAIYWNNTLNSENKLPKCTLYLIPSELFVCAFTKLGKAKISFDASVCLSVSSEQLGSHRKDFSENFIFETFSNVCLENSSFIKM